MNPRSSNPLSSTVRTEGRLSGDAVASAIAVGSASRSRTCSNQCVNWRIGFGSECASLSGSPTYSRRMSARDIQLDLVTLDDNARGSAFGQRTEKHRFRERLLHLALDQPCHRTRAECTVEPLGGQPRA